MGYVNNALIFLIQFLFGAYILAVMLRFLLQMVRADFYNPLSQFLVKVTNPPLKPLRRVVPGLAGMDMASLVLALMLQIVEILLIGLVAGAPGPSMLGIVFYSLTELFTLMLYIFIFSIFIQAIISWINPGSYNPMSGLLYQITSPIMRPIQRRMSPMSGLDLSPMVALLVLWLVKLLLADPLGHMALQLAYGNVMH